MRDMFETRTHAWREAGLERELNPRRVNRARRDALIFLPAIVGVLVLNDHRRQLFPGFTHEVRILTVIVLMILGWAFARAMGRSLAPMLFKRVDPATAGTIGFLIRLATITIALLVALRIAGLDTRTLAIGGAVTAVVLGLAAQQTVGNLFAGTVLLSARPFRVGERVRFQGGPIAGQLEGVVSSLGLLYTTLASGDDRIMIPNSVILNMAVTPLREPDAVVLRARLPADVRPSAVQEVLDATVQVMTRSRPDIELQELDGDEVVVLITATPERPSEGAQLADEILSAISRFTRNGGSAAPDPA
ncbi:MAG: small conductance mechanosensitive channel [Thermoleophilaceae bacterium]|jgi:small-conductance mechanosensitive channel|nr:small conductance mechanosensitive channel [Thermoleophilaceae bacterium]